MVEKKILEVDTKYRLKVCVMIGVLNALSFLIPTYTKVKRKLNYKGYNTVREKILKLFASLVYNAEYMYREALYGDLTDIDSNLMHKLFLSINKSSRRLLKSI